MEHLFGTASQGWGGLGILVAKLIAEALLAVILLPVTICLAIWTHVKLSRAYREHHKLTSRKTEDQRIPYAKAKAWRGTGLDSGIAESEFARIEFGGEAESLAQIEKECERISQAHDLLGPERLARGRAFAEGSLIFGSGPRPISTDTPMPDDSPGPSPCGSV